MTLDNPQALFLHELATIDETEQQSLQMLSLLSLLASDAHVAGVRSRFHAQVPTTQHRG